jgi:Zn-dependent protease
VVQPSEPRPQQGIGGRRFLSLFGIPVQVSPWTLALIGWLVFRYGAEAGALTGWTSGGGYPAAFLLAVLLVTSVFLHELGHALASRFFGIRVRSVTLWALGGFTEMEHEAQTPGREFGIAFAGPGVSLALGAVGIGGGGVLPADSVAAHMLHLVGVMNVVLGIFNVLPGFPLDGGRLLQSLVWRVTGDRLTGMATAGWAGRVLAVALGVYTLVQVQATGYEIGNVLFTGLIVMFIWSGATQAIRAAALGRRYPMLDAGRMAAPSLLVPHDLPLAEALRRADEAGLRSVVIVDDSLRPVALVSSAAVNATPIERRPWLPVSAAGRTLHPGLVLPATLRGEDVLRAVQSSPATEYLVVDGDPDRGGRVVGVLQASAVADILDPRKTG